ncbi:MAG: sulfite exporter TauE/SafE family protein [Gammaproteobacteria bacterium]|nr:sulfite exporter TauE/SafE family protein [Gammaproteobacteria bacterium]NNF60498.1 sulfite exporter TauE/SafE family protein [Gammaproteobacteria bacterium]NNM20157.1 sulfite exporter TauE/SafE family protein [Gammaproteobacteria bacterium]
MNVMAGGGSMLSVPVMLILGIPGPVANGTNRIAILAQNIVAVATFFRHGHADFKLSLSLALAATPGAMLGAMIGVRLDGPWFERTLAVIMILVMILMWVRPGKADAAEPARELTRTRLVWGHICMFGAGIWGGFIQIGVGFILMPILHRVLGFDLVRVNMHKVFIVLVYTVVALIVFASQLELLWLVGLSLAVGNATGGWLGAHTTAIRGESLVRIVFYGILTVFILRLLLF